MTTQIGGLNIEIGATIANAIRGVDTLTDSITSFQKKMSQINLAGAIKGDPFKETMNYVKQARSSLDEVFQKWATNIDAGAKNFAHFSEASKRATEKVLRDWQTLDAKMSALKGMQGLRERFDTTAGTDQALAAAKQGLHRNLTNAEVNDVIGKQTALNTGPEAIASRQQNFNMVFRRYLDSFKNFEGELGARSRSLIKTIDTALVNGTQYSDKTLRNWFWSFNKVLKQYEPGILSDYEKFGKELKATFTKLGQAEMYAAKSPTLARMRQAKATHELSVEEQRLRTEIGLGMNVQKNQINLYKTLLQQKELGNKLTEAEVFEMKKLKKVYLNYQDEQRGGILSPEWFKRRAVWFLQLRGFWAVYQGLQEAGRNLVEMQTQVARAMRTSNSTIMDSTGIYEKYSQAMREVVGRFNAEWKDAGEILYQFGSAGLSSEKAIAGLVPAMQLLIGTEGDARELTKSVAGIYNNFANTMSDVGGEEAKLKHISDLLANTWKDTQVEISELTEGYKNASSSAKAAGVNLDVLNAILAVANQHMIKGSRAGTAFRNMVSRMTESMDKFKDVYGVSFDSTKPLNLIDIFRQLHNQMVKDGKSLNDLAAANERFGLRAQDLFLILTEFYPELENRLAKQKDSIDAAGKIAEERMDNVASQAGRFMKNIYAGLGGLKEVQGVLNALKTTFKFYADQLGTTVRQDVIDTIISKGYAANKEEMARAYTTEELTAAIDELNKKQERHLKTLAKQKDADAYYKIYARNMIKVYEEQKKTIAETIALREKLRLKGEAKGIKAQQEAPLTDEQAQELLTQKRLYEQKYAGLTIEDKINKKMTERGMLTDQIYDTEQLLGKSRVSDYETYKRINELHKAREVIDKDIEELNNEATRERNKQLNLEDQISKYNEDSANATLQELEARKDILISGRLTKKELSEAYQILDKMAKVKAGAALSQYEQDLNRIAKLNEDEDANLVAVNAAGKKYEDTLKTINREKEKGYKDIGQKITQTELNQLNIEEQVTDLELRRLERSKANLEQGKLTASEFQKVLDINKKIYGLKLDKASLDYNKAVTSARDDTEAVEIAARKLGEAIEVAGEEKEKGYKDIGQKLVQTELNQLNIEEQVIDLELRKFERSKANLEQGRLTTSEFQKVLDINEKIYGLNLDKAFLDYNKAVTSARDDTEAVEIAARKLGEAIEVAGEEFDKSGVAAKMQRLKNIIQEINTTAEKTITSRNAEISMLKIQLADEEKIAAVEGKVLYDRLDALYKIYEAQKMLDDNENDRLQTLNQINQLHIEISENAEKQLRAIYPLYDAYNKIVESTKTWKQFQSDLIVQMRDIGVSGATDIGFKLTGGFQEQRQAAADLESQLEDLKNQYDEAINQGDVLKAAELADQMGELKNNISDLKNPLKQAGEMFKSFLKDTVDGIRKVIIEWLAMKAFMGIGSLLGLGGTPAATLSVAEQGWMMGRATGGILPQIKAFRKFSKGGMTNSPTLALLGDNRSKKELIIPQENIKSDSVSGYMRDSGQNVTVINVLTQEDILKTINTTAGEKVIINHIGKAIQSNNPVLRSMRA